MLVDPAVACKDHHQELCLQTPSVHGDPLGPFLQGIWGAEGEPGFNQQKHLGMDRYQVLGYGGSLKLINPWVPSRPGLIFVDFFFLD